MTAGSVEAIRSATEGAAGCVVILSANPLHDTGGGQRSAQLALEFLERDFAVLFVSHGQVTETTDLDLTYRHARLVELELDELDADISEALVESATGDASLVITQVPVESWMPVLEQAKAGGFVTIYDCIDRWDSELGRGWYRSRAEESVARTSDLLVASAPALREHVERFAGREAVLLPNAYNARIFRQSAPGDACPDDLPDGGPVALYVGALWGGWLDWELVRTLATEHPETRFVFVGDHRGEGRGLPRNCHFLGLKPQAALPAYLAAADVAFLPWKANDVTQATSPLKVYEFLAMGLPVIAPEIEPLRGLPGVTLCAGEADFVRAVGSVGRSHLDAETSTSMKRFSDQNSWEQRVNAMLPLVAEANDAGQRSAAYARPRTGASLSVVIPAYNHEHYVGRAIESVRGQTLPAAELIIVDDGSADGTRDVIADHAFRRMRVFTQENRGAHRALNRAISLSSGDYVAILNSDDAFEPEWLEQAWGVTRASGSALVCGSVRLIDDEGGPVDPSHDIAQWYAEARAFGRSAPTLAAALRQHNVAVTTSNFFMHRELWVRLGGFAAYRYVHDYDFLLRAVALCGSDVRYEDALQGVQYRVHGVNTISESRARADAERMEMKRALSRPMTRLRRLAGRRAGRAALRAAIEAPGSLAPVVPNGGDHHVSEPLRAGIVVESLGTGGLEEVVALLAQSLPTLGVPTSVLCTRTGGVLADRLRAAGVPVHVAGGRTGALASWVTDHGISVLSSHFVNLDALTELSGAGAPILETIQNTYAWFTKDDWLRERRKLDVLHGTIAVSDTVAAYYRRHTEHEPRWIVPNAVHPGRAASVPRAFGRAALGISDETPLFVSVGRITVQKNPFGLLRAFERVTADRPDAVLLLVGPADRSVPVSRLRSRHRSLFSSGAVRHVRTVNDVGSVLSAADVFVSNSFYEGWSVAASEAAWVGLPMVLSETGGATDLVGSDPPGGIIVPNPCGERLAVDRALVASPPPRATAANESALAAAMLEMMEDGGEWAARRGAIRERARRTLGPLEIAGRYVDVMKVAVAEFQAPGASAGD